MSQLENQKEIKFVFSYISFEWITNKQTMDQSIRGIEGFLLPSSIASKKGSSLFMLLPYADGEWMKSNSQILNKV